MNTEIGKIGLIVNQFLAEDEERTEVTPDEIKQLAGKTKSHRVAVEYWLKRAQFRENKILGSFFKQYRKVRTTQDHLDKASKS